MRIPSARGQERINCHSAPWRADAKNKAYDGGYAIGCSNLGSMYLNGDGVRQDKSKALQLFGKACDMKDEDGCKNYAILKNQGIK